MPYQNYHYSSVCPMNYAKDVFYEQVQTIIDKIPKHNIVLLMEDWNAKVGDQKDS